MPNGIEKAKTAYDFVSRLGDREFFVWVAVAVACFALLDNPGVESNIKIVALSGWVVVSAAFILGRFWNKNSENGDNGNSTTPSV